MGSHRTRFADFLFDPSSGELWRGDRLVHLERQPACVLARLVSTPFELVTRESLAEVLWGDDTHVETDDGLNYCIRQVRLALGDNPKAPVFIETIPRRGYRFIAEVRPETRPHASRLMIPAVAAALFMITVVAESRPNNHHEVAVSLVRAVHDLIF